MTTLSNTLKYEFTLLINDINYLFQDCPDMTPVINRYIFKNICADTNNIAILGLKRMGKEISESLIRSSPTAVFLTEIYVQSKVLIANEYLISNNDYYEKLCLNEVRHHYDSAKTQIMREFIGPWTTKADLANALKTAIKLTAEKLHSGDVTADKYTGVLYDVNHAIKSKIGFEYWMKQTQQGYDAICSVLNNALPGDNSLAVIQANAVKSLIGYPSDKLSVAVAIGVISHLSLFEENQQAIDVDFQSVASSLFISDAFNIDFKEGFSDNKEPNNRDRTAMIGYINFQRALAYLRWLVSDLDQPIHYDTYSHQDDVVENYTIYLIKDLECSITGYPIVKVPSDDINFNGSSYSF